MKKIIFFRVLMFVCGVCFLATIASAQESPDTEIETPATKPTVSTPGTIALAFYKLTRQAPDFESWAQQTQAYKDASPFEQQAVQEAQVEKMKEAYNLLMLTEPLVIETQVKLSPYYPANKGFFVDSFKETTFFPVHYNGRSYAVVPLGIMDKQWLKVDDLAVAKSIEESARSDRRLTMVLLLTPRYADASAATTIDGETYWPIAVDVKKMMLYPLNSDTLLWQSYDTDAKDEKDEKHQNILNLYQ